MKKKRKKRPFVMRNEARRLVSLYLKSESSFYQFQLVKVQYNDDSSGSRSTHQTGTSHGLTEAQNKVRWRYQLLGGERPEQDRSHLETFGESRLSTILEVLSLRMAEDGTVKVPKAPFPVGVMDAASKSGTTDSFVVADDSSQQQESLRVRIKQELKKFDSDFRNTFGRLPSKTDKEPLKPLYALYKGLRDSNNGSLSVATNTTTATTTNTKTGATAAKTLQDLKSEMERLKQKKTKLRSLLETYQDRFLRENHRKVLYHKDLLPIETEFLEYKSVKSQIKQLEELCSSQR